MKNDSRPLTSASARALAADILARASTMPTAKTMKGSLLILPPRAGEIRPLYLTSETGREWGGREAILDAGGFVIMPSVAARSLLNDLVSLADFCSKTETFIVPEMPDGLLVRRDGQLWIFPVNSKGWEDRKPYKGLDPSIRADARQVPTPKIYGLKL